MPREFVQAHRFFNIGLHQFNGLHQLWLIGPKLVLQRNALSIVLPANSLTDELFGDRVSEWHSMVAANQGQHHVHRRGAAAARVSVPIQFEEFR